MSSTKQPRARLAKLIADRTMKDGVSADFAREVAAYIMSEKRTADLESILRDVQVGWADAGHVEVVAVSAHELNDVARAEIRAEVQKLYPEASKVVITEVQDPEVVGGVRLNVADQQLDLTLQAKLNKFKQLTAA